MPCVTEVSICCHGSFMAAGYLAAMPKVRSVFLSDIHLGTRACEADVLLDFLREHPIPPNLLALDPEGSLSSALGVRGYPTTLFVDAEGRIVLGRLEIAQLDNDPNYPERGVLRLELHGGK